MGRGIGLITSVFLLLLSCVSKVNAEGGIIINSSIEAAATEVKGEAELTLSVALEDLYFDQENISVNVDGLVYTVHSLKKQGNQWIANAANEPKCAWGHPLCVGEHGCGQCHTKICPLYQPRTSYCR